MTMTHPPQQQPSATRQRPRWPWIVAGFAAAIAAAVGITLAATGDRGTPDATTTATAAAPETTTEQATEQAMEPIHQDTILACRSLADSTALADFWQEVNNGRVPSPMVEGMARMAVIQLGAYVDDPDVDPAVVAAMSNAVLEVTQMTGKTMDVEEFRAAISPVVTACQDADVDMGMPE